MFLNCIVAPWGNWIKNWEIQKIAFENHVPSNYRHCLFFALVLCASELYFILVNKLTNNYVNLGEELTLARWSPSEKPINKVIIARNKTKSNTIPKELPGLGLKPMTVIEIHRAPYGHSPCGSWFLEAQPPCHHWVYSITPNQHLWSKQFFTPIRP